jgi:hypothetical protein
MLSEVVLPELDNIHCTTTLKSFGSKMALHRITVYDFENSLITAFRSGSDGVLQLTGPTDHMISRHVIFRCGE